MKIKYHFFSKYSNLHSGRILMPKCGFGLPHNQLNVDMSAVGASDLCLGLVKSNAWQLFVKSNVGSNIFNRAIHFASHAQVMLRAATANIPS